VTHGRRLIWLLLGGLAFGVVVAVVKGQADDVRNALGNTSAPWVVPPFIAGMSYGRALHGALAGVAVTIAAFLGFYVAEAVILDLGPHPWYVDLQLTVGTIYIYEKFGLVSGLVYGALGSLWASRRLVAAAVAVGLAFVAEPVVVYALSRAGLWGASLARYPGLWIAEAIVGLALVAWFYRRGSATAAAPS
jgi:uncharacterized protein DUF6518